MDESDIKPTPPAKRPAKTKPADEAAPAEDTAMKT
jgi:hypothetical protein